MYIARKNGGLRKTSIQDDCSYKNTISLLKEDYSHTKTNNILSIYQSIYLSGECTNSNKKLFLNQESAQTLASREG